MTAEASPIERADHRSLAAELEPVLRRTCDERLGPVAWFKADWQRGGAATGTATWRDEAGVERPVIVKLPVSRREFVWTRRLQPPAGTGDDPVVPRLHASGEELNGYDLAWLVMERFEHGPLGVRWGDDHLPRIAEAAARFHHAAAAFEVDQPPRTEAWDRLVDTALEAVRINQLPESKRWTDALKRLRARLDEIVTEWRARDTRQWLHGDLHIANAMSRRSLDEGPVCLIDLAEVHAGHWVEDAVYLERQLWSRPDRLKPHKPVRLIAAARRRLGLPVEPGDTRLAMIRRVLLAATAPDFLRSEGTPAHLEACRQRLEQGLDAL